MRSDTNNSAQPAPVDVPKTYERRALPSLAVHLPWVVVLLSCFLINVRGVCTGGGTQHDWDFFYKHGWPFRYASHSEDFTLFFGSDIDMECPWVGLFDVVFAVGMVLATASSVPARLTRWREGSRFTVADLLSLAVIVAVALGVAESELLSYIYPIFSWAVSWQELGCFHTAVMLFGIACICDRVFSWGSAALSWLHSVINRETGRDDPGNHRQPDAAPRDSNRGRR